LISGSSRLPGGLRSRRWGKPGLHSLVRSSIGAMCISTPPAASTSTSLPYFLLCFPLYFYLDFVLTLPFFPPQSLTSSRPPHLQRGALRCVSIPFLDSFLFLLHTFPICRPSSLHSPRYLLLPSCIISASNLSRSFFLPLLFISLCTGFFFSIRAPSLADSYLFQNACRGILSMRAWRLDVLSHAPTSQFQFHCASTSSTARSEEDSIAPIPLLLGVRTTASSTWVERSDRGRLD
jgi:hypothetical protein